MTCRLIDVSIGDRVTCTINESQIICETCKGNIPVYHLPVIFRGHMQNPTEILDILELVTPYTHECGAEVRTIYAVCEKL